MADSSTPAAPVNNATHPFLSNETSHLQERDSHGWSASKRHREKLNEQVENLGKLLPFPEDVLGKLDKLSVLRLTASYFRLHNYIKGRKEKEMKNKDEDISEERTNHAGHVLVGDLSSLLLELIEGFLIVICDDGVVLYVSENVKDHTGYHQTSLMHHNFIEYIHQDDQAYFKDGINFQTQMKKHAMKNGSEKLQEVRSSFINRLKCHAGRQVSHVSPFYHKAFRLHGVLKPLYLRDAHGSPKYGFFALCCPIKQNGALLAKPKDLYTFFNTRHGMDLSFKTMDSLGLKMLGYGKTEISLMSPYFIAHPDDMPALQQAHHEIIHQGHTSCTFRLLNKLNKWQWISGSGQVFFKDSKASFVLTTNRGVSAEEGIEIRMRWEAERNIKTIDEHGQKVVQWGSQTPLPKNGRKRPERKLKSFSREIRGEKKTTDREKKLRRNQETEQSRAVSIHSSEAESAHRHNIAHNVSTDSFHVAGRQLPNYNSDFLSNPNLLSLGVVFPVNPDLHMSGSSFEKEHSTAACSSESGEDMAEEISLDLPDYTTEEINRQAKVEYINVLPTYEEVLSLYNSICGISSHQPDHSLHIEESVTIPFVNNNSFHSNDGIDLQNGSNICSPQVHGVEIKNRKHVSIMSLEIQPNNMDLNTVTGDQHLGVHMDIGSQHAFSRPVVGLDRFQDFNNIYQQQIMGSCTTDISDDDHPQSNSTNPVKTVHLTSNCQPLSSGENSNACERLLWDAEKSLVRDNVTLVRDNATLIQDGVRVEMSSGPTFDRSSLHMSAFPAPRDVDYKYDERLVTVD